MNKAAATPGTSENGPFKTMQSCPHQLKGARKMADTTNDPHYGRLPAEGFVRMDKLIGERIIPMGRTSLLNAVKAGDFPAPIKLGGMNVWDVRVIRAWIDEKSAGREVGSEKGLMSIESAALRGSM